MLQRIATKQEELDHASVSSNTQGSHGVKVGGQDHDSGGPYLPLSKKPSSLRPHQASDKRRGDLTSSSRSNSSSNDDGGCSSASERDCEIEVIVQSQAMGGFRSKTKKSKPDSVVSYHHEREAEYLDPYSPGLDLPLDENHPPTEYRVARPGTSELLSKGSRGQQRNGSDTSSIESNDLAEPILAANGQDPKLSEKDSDFRESSCSSDQEPDNEDRISVSCKLPTAQSLQRRPKTWDGEAGDSLAKVHRAHKDEDIEDFEIREHQLFPKSNSKDVSDGAETEAYSINRFRVSDDAFDTNDTYPSRNLQHAIRNSDSKLTETQTQASESLKSGVSKTTTVSQDAERNGMNEAQAEVTQAEVWRGRFRDMARRLKSIPSLIPTRVRPSSSTKTNTNLQENNNVPIR